MPWQKETRFIQIQFDTSFAKSLYMHAVEHSNSDSVLDRAISIVNFDGSVETFLYALNNYLGAEVKERAKYSELINAVKTKLANPTLIEELSLNNMHIARNDVQHHGIIPCFTDAQRYKTLTYQVLSELSKEVLEKDFEEISLSDLIKNPLVRSLYKKGEDAYFAGNFRDTLIYTASAFEKAKRIEQTKLWGSGLTFDVIKKALDNKDNSNDEILETIIEELETLKLRLDYKQYQKYREVFWFRLKPFFNITSDNEEEIVKAIKEESGTLIKIWDTAPDGLKSQAIYCLSFALDSILMWESVERSGWSEVISTFWQAAGRWKQE